MALDYNIMGKRIKEIRLKKKITQQQLAEKLDVSVSTISRIERGDFKISLSRLNEISEFLGVKEGQILNGTSFSDPYYLNSDIAKELKNSSINNHNALYEIAQILNKYFPKNLEP